ncbi:hypothetical protein FSARC_8703 [Fusarium sarcochroum]|uniref:Integral membrane protein n=1 Tax=Fusarium sarcochroum TaxID=1208366 RepID=A0A8H4TSK2_9HYPO|nr:hypothetical protein FSARC_8703 [Fusarium sarcochroum]
MGLGALAVYGLGLACIARSLMAFTQPQAEYALNGLKHTIASNDDPSSGPIYMLGTWELSVGVLLLTHEANGNTAGVTALLGLMSLFKAGNAVLLWRIGDQNKMSKVAGNVVTAVVLSAWAWYEGQS